MRFGAMILAIGCTAFGLAALGLTAAAPAQDAPKPKRTVDQDPFDRITLDKANGEKVFQIQPLPLPGSPRQLPSYGPNDTLKIRFLDRLWQEYEVAYRVLSKVELYEQILFEEAVRFLREAGELDKQGQFESAKVKYDHAYDNLAYLFAAFPQMNGLAPTLQQYLYQNAGSLFRQQKFPQALSMLEELHRLNPSYQSGAAPLTTVMVAIVDRMLDAYLKAEDFRSARMLIVRLTQQYGEQKFAQALKARAKLIADATQWREQVRGHLAADRLREADTAVRKLLNIWPDLEGAADLAAETARRYPVVFVGVTRPATEFVPDNIGNWAARRAGHLVHRTLLEFTGAGPEGGEYVCPLGTVTRSPDRKRLTLRLTDGPNTITGYDVSDQLLALARPGSANYLPAWANLFQSVRVEGVTRLQVDLRRPHVLPEALLQTVLHVKPPLPNAVASGDGAYFVSPSEKAGNANRSAGGNGDGSPGGAAFPDVRFQLRDVASRGAGQPAEIIERTFEDSQRAIEALRRGDVDLVDHVFPSDALRLMADDTVKNEIQVESFGLPSVHLIVPNLSRPYTGSRTFRRAIAFAIDRKKLLEREILGGTPVEGFRVLSGPFPAGVKRNDPLAYAYDEQLAQREWNPWLAATLVQLAKVELETIANAKKEPVPELKELTLVHPAFEEARVACAAIVPYLGLVGIKVKLRELPPGQTIDTTGDWDLMYLEIGLWEPLVDARRLLAPDGIVGVTNPYVGLALRMLDGAEEWGEARERLKDLHRTTYTEVSVVPLWQTIDYFAYRKKLQGLPKKPLHLYSKVEQWQVSATAAKP